MAANSGSSRMEPELQTGNSSQQTSRANLAAFNMGSSPGSKSKATGRGKTTTRTPRRPAPPGPGGAQVVSAGGQGIGSWRLSSSSGGSEPGTGPSSASLPTQSSNNSSGPVPGQPPMFAAQPQTAGTSPFNIGSTQNGPSVPQQQPSMSTTAHAFSRFSGSGAVGTSGTASGIAPPEAADVTGVNTLFQSLHVDGAEPNPASSASRQSGGWSQPSVGTAAPVASQQQHQQPASATFQPAIVPPSSPAGGVMSNNNESAAAPTFSIGTSKTPGTVTGTPGAHRRRTRMPAPATPTTATPPPATSGAPLPGMQPAPTVPPVPTPGSVPWGSPMMWSPMYPGQTTTTPLPAHTNAGSFTPATASSQASDMSYFRATPAAAQQQPQQPTADAGPSNTFSFGVRPAGVPSQVLDGGGNQGLWGWTTESNGARPPAGSNTQAQGSGGAAPVPAANVSAASHPFAAPSQAAGPAAAKVSPSGASSSVSSPGNDTVQGKDTNSRAQTGTAPLTAAPAAPQGAFGTAPVPASWPSTGFGAEPVTQPPGAAGTSGSSQAPAAAAPQAFAFTAATRGVPAAASESAFVFSGPAPQLPVPLVDINAALQQPAFSLGATFNGSNTPNGVHRHRSRTLKPQGTRTPAKQANLFSVGGSSGPETARAGSSGGGGSSGETAAPVHAAPSQSPEERMAQRVEARRQKADQLKQHGNELYKAQNYKEADKAYSQALDTLRVARASNSELAVLYSNRAGARIMIGMPEDALSDAQKAMGLDTKFFRAVSRAATCHCRMGNFKAASQLLEKTLDNLSKESPLLKEVRAKMDEVNHVAEEVDKTSSALKLALWSGSGGGTGSSSSSTGGTGPDKLRAVLTAVQNLHPNVVYSESMAAMRVTTLLALGRFSEALAACVVDYEAPQVVKEAPWRLWLAMQAHYLAGDLQAAWTKGKELEEALKNASCRDPVAQAAAEGTAASFGGDSTVVLKAVGLRPPSLPEVVAARESIKRLMDLKEAGNKAIKDKKHQDAVESYTDALALCPPPVYAAVLHSNRAAAHQGLGSVLDAAADCLRARALDRSYLKAFTRLAGLLMEVRRPGVALEILEGVTRAGSGVTVSQGDRAGLASQVTEAKANATWQTTSDHYQLMGLARTCPDDEIRTAYRKAALRHHPDKAVSLCKFGVCIPVAKGPALPMSPPRKDGPLPAAVQLVGEAAGIEARVKEEAAWLFNFVSQAYEELGDKARRRKVDMLLEVEVAPVPRQSRGYGGGGYGGNSFYHQAHDVYGSTFGSTFQPRSGSSAYGYRPAQPPPAAAGRASSASNGSSGAARGGTWNGGYTGHGARGYGRASGSNQPGAGYGPGSSFSGGYGPGSSFGGARGGAGRSSSSYRNPYSGDFSGGESDDETGHY